MRMPQNNFLNGHCIQFEYTENTHSNTVGDVALVFLIACNACDDNESQLYEINTG